MTQDLTVMNSKSAREMVLKVRKAVRRWYATVSVRELVFNKALVAEIEALERILSGQKAVAR